MNTVNNKKKRESQRKLESAFIELLQEKEDIHQISVVSLCKKAQLNRSTFYSSYLDIYDLIDKIGQNLINDLHELYIKEETNHYNSHDFLKLFKHVKENKLFYKTYFQLGLDLNWKSIKYDKNLAKKLYDEKHIDYHIEYSKAGITAILKHWINNNCDLSPEELFEIFKEEYKDKSIIYKS